MAIDSGMIMTDELVALVERVGKGDKQAFAVLYQRTSPRLYTLAISVLRNRDLAQEVLQESFINVWKSASSYHSGKGSVQVWLNVVVRNRCIDCLRQRMTQIHSSDFIDWNELVCNQPSPLQTLQNHHEAKDLARCMEGLSGPQKQALTLAFFHGLSHSELAEKTQSPLGSIKSSIRRGLASLRRCLHHASNQ
jgi:RNA polymerase sigma-70 factor (ECF subfamily)